MFYPGEVGEIGAGRYAGARPGARGGRSYGAWPGCTGRCAVVRPGAA
ncbi:hypothetical protein CU044_2653 [Streptomyces sp. L-9-10]|nr:hypothetical protein CU044_2653 [Streptomyces sp. L-9-10]